MTARSEITAEYSTVDEQALAWRVRIEADRSLETSVEFLSWFDLPQAREAYSAACATWDAFEDHLATTELITVRRDALRRAQRTALSRKWHGRSRFTAFAAGLLVALALATTAWS